MSDFFYDSAPPAAGKVMLATTVYEKPSAEYTFSIQRSREALHKAGIPTEYALLAGNCHVDDARNSIVHEFLLSDCESLVFIDADISWKPDDLLKLCKCEKPLAGGVYPYRRRSDEMPVRPVWDTLSEDGLLEVEGLPTGFMKIARSVLETLAQDAKSHPKQGDRRAMVPIIFERTFDQGTRWGGDLAFCNKWRAAGGKVYALPDLVLGHVGKMLFEDSLAAMLRRRAGTTLPYIVDLIRKEAETSDLMAEAVRLRSNSHTLHPGGLLTCVKLARIANGPIIEAGSGLSTILMAAATKQTVFSLEHSRVHAAMLAQMALEAGVDGVGVCCRPLDGDWYDLTAFSDLPNQFALGLNDGPPRLEGDRRKFFDRFGDITDTIICDDADDPHYAEFIAVWCREKGRPVEFVGRLAIITR